MFEHFSIGQWLLAFLGAFFIGFSKSGFSGSGLITVLIMARLFDARESTGALLPMLICGDIFSVIVFHQHARWALIWKMLPPTVIGIIAGYLVMRVLPGSAFAPVIGWIVLLMAVLQAVRRWLPSVFERVPHTMGFALSMGVGTGFTTMLANGAGPVMALYLIAIGTPKYALVGTSAWFFLIVNVLKLPFSAGLGLIHLESLKFDAVLVPVIALGIWAGRRLITVISQNVFEALLLAFAAVASLRLIFF